MTPRGKTENKYFTERSFRVDSDVVVVFVLSRVHIPNKFIHECLTVGSQGT